MAENPKGSVLQGLVILGVLVTLIGWGGWKAVSGIRSWWNDPKRVEQAASENSNREERKRQEAVKKAEHDQKELLAFEKAFLSTIAPCDSAAKAASEAMTVQNSISSYTTSGEAVQACTAAQVAFTDLGRKIPDELPDDIKDLLKESTTAMSIACYVRKNGFKAFMNYVDERKPKYLAESNEKMQFGAGASKLNDAKRKLGISSEQRSASESAVEVASSRILTGSFQRFREIASCS